VDIIQQLGLQQEQVVQAVADPDLAVKDETNLNTVLDSSYIARNIQLNTLAF
jgi:hypothetical protein